MAAFCKLFQHRVDQVITPFGPAYRGRPNRDKRRESLHSFALVLCGVLLDRYAQRVSIVCSQSRTALCVYHQETTGIHYHRLRSEKPFFRKSRSDRALYAGRGGLSPISRPPLSCVVRR